MQDLVPSEWLSQQQVKVSRRETKVYGKTLREVFISAVTGVANTLLNHAGLRRSVHGIEQCGSVLFSQLYEALTGARPPRPRGVGGSEAERCQAVVEALSEQLSPHVSLDHIRGGDLAAREPLTIINLLDIFSGSRHFETLHCSLSACTVYDIQYV